MNKKTQAILDNVLKKHKLTKNTVVEPVDEDVVVYYIGWKGAINNTQQGEVDLAGGLLGKKYALSVMKEMKKLYKRGKVTLHTKPLSERAGLILTN